jgi:hypothetical protein
MRAGVSDGEKTKRGAHAARLAYRKANEEKRLARGAVVVRVEFGAW